MNIFVQTNLKNESLRTLSKENMLLEELETSWNTSRNLRVPYEIVPEWCQALLEAFKSLKSSRSLIFQSNTSFVNHPLSIFIHAHEQFILNHKFSLSPSLIIDLIIDLTTQIYKLNTNRPFLVHKTDKDLKRDNFKKL